MASSRPSSSKYTIQTITGAFSLLLIVVVLLLLPSSTGGASSRKLNALVKEQPLVLNYHNGPLLKGQYTAHFVWYGSFTPSQRSILLDFVLSLNYHPSSAPAPSVSTWWRTTEGYKGGSTTFALGKQLLLAAPTTSPQGAVLKSADIASLASRVLMKGPTPSSSSSIVVVLTAADVAVEGFCSSRCGSHGAAAAGSGSRGAPYVWVGNSASQCPGQCAWPFHQPMYGPQGPPLVAPSGDVGVDGMVINLSTLLAGAVTNPFGSGYFQGPKEAPLEAVSACTGVFGKGAYPGYPGEVLVDKATGASYNAQGLNGRKYLLPAMWDPKTSQCSTLV